MFDHKARKRNFKEGDRVLVWDKRKEKLGMHKKFDSLWTRSYRIVSEASVNSLTWLHLNGRIYRYHLMDTFSSPTFMTKLDLVA
jgi:hypothetical protein